MFAKSSSVNSDDPQPAPARKAKIIAALTRTKAQSKEERLASAYTREKVMALDSLDRLRLLRNAQMEGLSRLYALHPQSDVSPGVYTIITILSDNGTYGASYLQISRLAKYLHRDERTVSRAIRKLVKDGLLADEVRPGKSTLYWPVHATSIDLDVPPAWFLDAHAPAPARPGRPRKTPDTVVQGFSGTPGTTDETPPAPPPKTPGTACGKPPSEAVRGILLTLICAPACNFDPY